MVEETGVPGENHRPVASHCRTLSHNVVSSTPHPTTALYEAKREITNLGNKIKQNPNNNNNILKKKYFTLIKKGVIRNRCGTKNVKTLLLVLKEVDPAGLHRKSGIHTQEILKFKFAPHKQKSVVKKCFFGRKMASYQQG